MSKKHKKFADDGWAVWVDGDDTSTVYINDWLNPKGKSYVDMAIRVRGIKLSKFLCVYVPFAISYDEIEDEFEKIEKEIPELLDDDYNKLYILTLYYDYKQQKGWKL